MINLYKRFLDWTLSLHPQWVGGVLFTAVAVVLVYIFAGILTFFVMISPAITLTVMLISILSLIGRALYLAIWGQ